jgi:hypothetical protein
VSRVVCGLTSWLGCDRAREKEEKREERSPIRMAQVLAKEYECLTCKAPVKLERKADNSGWIKWNPDGTEHIHPKKNFPQQSKTLEKVEQLERKIDTLIAQIQMLRSDVKELKERK